jgi:hypothetical protein
VRLFSSTKFCIAETVSMISKKPPQQKNPSAIRRGAQ